MLASTTAFAQLVIDASYTPQQLVQDVLVGQGVQVSNIQFSGSAQARGYFDGSNSNIGLSSGVILSTGKATDAPGPNDTDAGDPMQEQGTAFFTPGDAALTTLSGGQSPTSDAAILEFDFIPNSDTVLFKYVFASDEYMFWVDNTASGGATVNDLFAFFVSGPGITGEQNIALIPGTTTPITMQNVNADDNSQYYIDNGDEAGEQGGSTVSYNGFTTVLTAIGILQRCESYHIRLAIADNVDNYYDSAVFLDAGSFSSPTVSLNTESSYTVPGTPQQLVEGCSQMTLSFERSEPLNGALTVGLDITGSATVGADVSGIPNSITFQPGESTATITFSVLEDGVVESVEDLTITLILPNPSCAGDPPPSVTITIEDAVPLTLQAPPSQTLTCPQELTLTPTVSGGYPDYTYVWNGTVEPSGSITVFPFSTTNYNLTVTDACGFTASGSTLISLPSYQQIEVSVSDATVCGGEDAVLESTVTGGFGNISYLWDGIGMDPTYTVNPTTTTTVTLQVTDDCNISESATATVTVDEVEASFTYQLTDHSTVQFTSNTVDVYDFMWDFGDGVGSSKESPLHEYEDGGDYPVSLTVVNSNGCELTLYDTVTVYPPLHVYIPNTITPNGDGLNDVFGVIGEGFLYYDMEIFDRWGTRIKWGRFRDDSAWDGTYKNKPVPTGLYVYNVWVEPPIGIEFKEAGILYVISED